MSDPLYVMSPTEVVLGYVFGHDGTLPPPNEPDATPREALEGVIRNALLRPPCGVAFSGGRDSSAVLAIATHVARRDGLSEPVPITRVFPAIAESDEAAASQTGKELGELSAFIADLRAQVHDGRRFTPEQADQLGSDAQARGEAVAGQVSQHAAQLGIEIQQ